MSRLGQQLADLFFRFRVVTLARVLVADVPTGIDQILGRPVLIVEGSPDPIAVVECDRVPYVEVADGARDIRGIALECELG